MTDSTDRQSNRSEALERDFEDLSALLDSELSPAREAELRARMGERPELAEAFALMGGADQQLRALAGRPAAEHRLVRMRAGLDAKLAADAGARAGGAVVVAFPNRGRWMAAAAAALAAGLALYLVVDRPSSNGPTPSSDRIAEVPVEPDRIAHGSPANGPAAAPDALEAMEQPERVAAPAVAEARATDEALTVAERGATEGAPTIVDTPVIARAPDLIEESAPVLDRASEEEIAIALDYEALTDFEVIASLELLELLDDLDPVEAM